VAGILDQLNAQLQGNQAGNQMFQGALPNPSQPMGSPQLNNPAIEVCKDLISRMNTFADLLRRQNDDTNDKRTVMCVYKLQEILLDLKKKLADAANPERS
jgi:hypothetical protein